MPTFPVMRFKFYRKIKQQGKIIKQPLSFGLAYLTEKYQTKINQGIKLYDGLYEAYSGISQQKTQDYRNQIKLTYGSKAFAKLKIISQALRDDNKKVKDLEWQVHRSKLLQESSTWDAFEKAAFDKEALVKIQRIRRSWQNRAKFAHFPSDALLEIATHILPGLEDHILAAKNELIQYGHRVPPAIVHDYSDYLVTMLQKVKKERRVLAEAMFCRIRQTYYRKSLTEDDDIVTLGERLGRLCSKERLGKLNPATAFSRTPRQQMSQRAYNQFYAFIQQHGSTILNTRLRALAQTQFQGCHTLANKGQFWHVPNICKALTPEKPRWPAWLFKGHNLRHDFFKDKQYTVAALQLLPQISFKITDLSDLRTSPALKELNNVEKLLKQELANATQQTTSGFLGLFKIKTNAFLALWQQQIKAAQCQVVEKKIEMIDALAEKIAHHDPLDKKSAIPPYALDELKCWVNDQVKQVKNSTVPNHIKDNLNQAASDFNRALQNRPKPFLKKNLVESATQLVSNNPLNNPVTQISAGQAVKELKQNLTINFAGMDDEEFKLHVGLINNYKTLIQLSDDDKAKKRFDHCLSKYCIHYFQQLLEIKNGNSDRQHSGLLERLENIILSGGNEEHIRLIKDLVILRQQQDWMALRITIAPLLNPMINKCLTYHIESLDRKLFSYLQQHNKLQFNRHAMTALQAIKQRMINQYNIDVTQLSDLDASEKILLGINNNGSLRAYHYQEIRETLNLSAKLYLATTGLPESSHKSSMIAQMEQHLDDSIHNKQCGPTFSQLLAQKHKKLAFFKSAAEIANNNFAELHSNNRLIKE